MWMRLQYSGIFSVFINIIISLLFIIIVIINTIIILFINLLYSKDVP